MTIEQRLAEIIQAFYADALSSSINLTADLDIVLCVLARALLAAFRSRPGPGYATTTPGTLQRRFLDTPEPSPATTTPSPSPSAAAPTHPSCASPTSGPTPPSPGGKTAPSASGSPSQGGLSS